MTGLVTTVTYNDNMQFRDFAKKVPFLRNSFRALRFYLRTVPVPELRVNMLRSDPYLIRLGAEHGWSLLDRDYLYHSTIVSVGLGEDASFDTEFCTKYSADVILLDPTLKALHHYEEIAGSFGKKKLTPYSNGGGQLVSSYDLVHVNGEHFRMIPKALWISSGYIEFYPPKEAKSISYSITNLQNTKDAIKVPSTTYLELLNFIGKTSKEVALIKLDVEGAASEIIEDILNRELGPKQILVEFEELFTPSLKNYLKLRRVVVQLKAAGYILKYNDRFANFLYERSDA